MPSPHSPAPPPAATPRAPVRWVLALSSHILRTERQVLTGLMTLLVLLILLNVVTRYTGMPIYWVDEAAVYTVVWLTFVGASVMTRLIRSRMTPFAASTTIHQLDSNDGDAETRQASRGYRPGAV